MKLHLGCGGVILDGYLNIDSHSNGRPAEVIVDNAITLEHIYTFYPEEVGKIEEIISFHLFEHLPRVESKHGLTVGNALITWRDMLAPDGKLIIECPNFEEVIKDYVAGNTARINNIFGLNRFPGDTHAWGYTPASITMLLHDYGFNVVKMGIGTDYHEVTLNPKGEPCMRIESRKI